MSTDTRITVNGRVVEADGRDGAEVIAETVRKAPSAERYLIVKDGKPEAEIMWDGQSQFDPGQDATLVKTSEWKGEKYAGPPEDDATKAKRTFADRLDTLIGRLRDDYREFDSMNAAQRQAAQKRALRAVILLARESRGDFADDTE